MVSFHPPNVHGSGAETRADAKENVTLRAQRKGVGSSGAVPSYPVVHRPALPL